MLVLDCLLFLIKRNQFYDVRSYDIYKYSKLNKRFISESDEITKITKILRGYFLSFLILDSILANSENC